MPLPEKIVAIFPDIMFPISARELCAIGLSARVSTAIPCIICEAI